MFRMLKKSFYTNIILAIMPLNSSYLWDMQTLTLWVYLKWRWNLTTGAARPNPQGTFNVWDVTISETFILNTSVATIDGLSRYTVNNVSYSTPDTPLKLADYFSNGTGVYELDAFSKNSSNAKAVPGVFVASALHKGWTEIVLKNSLNTIDTWHLDGYSFFVVG